MVEISQGEIWWAELPSPAGSSPGFRRPVIVVQGDALNRSRIATAVCVPLTTNMRWADAPGNVLLSAAVSGLPKDSVANTSQMITVDRTFLADRVKKLPPKRLEQVMNGIDIVLGR
ncbi:MAG: type II toxin-antitoxin system PemK/MazF family toxin [Gemmatimonadaceae bacterium]